MQDAAAEDLNLSDGMAKVSISASDSHRGDAQSVRDQNMSNANEQDPEFDSETTIIFPGMIQRFEDSADENALQDDIESASCNKDNTASCGAQWDIFRRKDVPKLLEYLKRHSSELSLANCSAKHVRLSGAKNNSFLEIRLSELLDIDFLSATGCSSYY